MPTPLNHNLNRPAKFTIRIAKKLRGDDNGKYKDKDDGMKINLGGMLFCAGLLTSCLIAHAYENHKAVTSEEASPAGGLSFGAEGGNELLHIDFESWAESESKPGLFGRALWSGPDRTAFSCDVKGRWPSRGSLVFWSNGFNVKCTFQAGFGFFSIHGSNGWASFYKPGAHPWMGILSRRYIGKNNTETDNFVMLPESIAYGTDYNRWHQWALTWEGPWARLYLDGQHVAENQNFSLPANPSTLQFGGPNGMTILIDEIVLLDRPLSGTELRRVWLQQLQPLTQQLAPVPPADIPIRLDGKLDDDEWKGAMQFDGPLTIIDEGPDEGMLSRNRTRLYLLQDHENLYVGVLSEWPEHVKRSWAQTTGITGLLKAEHRERDASLEGDDQIVLELMPDWPNGPVYRMAVNAENTACDARFEAGKEPDYKWNSGWRTATSYGTEGWVFEAIIPREPCRIAGERRTGFNMRRIWTQLCRQHESWAWGSYIPESDMAALKVVDRKKETPMAVAETATEQSVESFMEELTRARVSEFEKIHGLRHPTLWAPAGLLSLSSKALPAIRFQFDPALPPAAVNMTLTSSDISANQPACTVGSRSGEQFATNSEKKDGSWVFALAKSFEDVRTGDLAVSLVDGAAGPETFRWTGYFLQEQTTELAKWYYLTKDLLRLRVYVGMLPPTVAQHCEVTADVEDTSAKGKALVSRTVDSISQLQPEVLLPLAAIPPGTYSLNVRVKSDGKLAAQHRLPFTKPPRPEWYDCAAGLSDKVPPPWTPVAVAGETVSVWGRQYRFNQSLFPEQIDTVGMPLLRAPIILSMKLADGTEATTAGGRCESVWAQRDPTQAAGERRLTLPSCEISNSLWLDYDGLLWFTITLTPKSTPLKINRLCFEIPLTTAFSQYINGYDYGLARTGKLPADGQWAGAVPAWVGNAYGGIQWVNDTSGQFRVSDEGRIVEVAPGKEGATMRVVLADGGIAVEKPLIFDFGIVATPVRPRYPDYRRWLSGDSQVQWGYTWFPKGQEYEPGATGWVGQRLIHRDKEHSSYCGPYVCTGAVCPNRDFLTYGDEWQADQTGADKSITQAVHSYRNYFLWRFHELFKKEPFAALYFDVSGALPSRNPFNDTERVLPDGHHVGTLGVLGNRDIVRRLYTMVKQKYPDAIIKFHQSGMPDLAYMSFADSFVDGENTFGYLGSHSSYYGFMRPDRYVAEYMGHNFGYVTDFLPQFTRAGAWNTASLATPQGVAVTDHVLGLTLLHDSNIWESYASPFAANRLRDALRKFHWGTQYKMIPWWEQKIAALPWPELYVSFYVDDGGTNKQSSVDSEGYYYTCVKGQARTVIAVFCNESDQKGVLKVPLKWEDLGLPSAGAGLAVTNAVHAKGFRMVYDKGTKKWVMGPLVNETDEMLEAMDESIEEGGAKKPDEKWDTDTGEMETMSADSAKNISDNKVPDEPASIQDGQLVFPITPWNFRMIVLEKKE